MPSSIPFGSIFDFSTFCWKKKKEFVLCALDGLVWYLGLPLAGNISVVNLFNQFTSPQLGSRLWTAVLPIWDKEDFKLSMYTQVADQAFAQILWIPMDNIFAQYRMLIITAFIFFIFYFLLPFRMGKFCFCVYACVRMCVCVLKRGSEKILSIVLVYSFDFLRPPPPKSPSPFSVLTSDLNRPGPYGA